MNWTIYQHLMVTVKAGKYEWSEELLDGSEELSFYQTKELLEIVIEQRRNQKWVQLIVKNGKVGSMIVDFAIQNDYPLDYLLESKCRIMSNMLLRTLEKEGAFHSLKSLLEMGAKANILNNALLRKAVDNANYLAVQLLLEYGADVKAISGKKKRILQRKSQTGMENAALTLRVIAGERFEIQPRLRKD